jgi:hypothetical protein
VKPSVVEESLTEESATAEGDKQNHPETMPTRVC